MTIHSSHPFPTGSDPFRRFRGRASGVVTLWTSGSDDPAGLTVSSLMVALGEPATVLALVDPDSDLHDVLTATGRAVVAPLAWTDRGLAEAFAGTAPAPGGPFRQASFVATEWGPRLASASTWAGVELLDARAAGWSVEVRCRIDHVEIGDPADPLLHHRGRFHRL